MKVLGCKVLVDEMGSIFAIRPGENNELPSIAIGSHLDTPLEDGRYSGITGVMAGVEIMRTLAENKVTTYAPIAVVNWTNGGGGRFPKAIVASGVWSGDIRLADAHNLQTHSDVPEETTMRSELERIGFKGDLSASHEANPLLAHFELYVDQHSVLQDQSIDVGIVTGGQAMLWYDVQIFGPAHISMNHEDPVSIFKNPMLRLESEISQIDIVGRAIEECKRRHGELGLCTLSEPQMTAGMILIPSC